MDRPRIRIETTAFDLFLEGLSLLALLILVGLPLLYWAQHWAQLPDSVPTHFDAAGRPDSYGSKGSLLALPFLGIALYVVLSFIQQVPHTFNYPVKITPDNAEPLFRHAVRMIRLLKVIITLGFAFILYRVIHTVLGQAEGLGAWFLPVFLLAMTVALGYGIWPAFRKA